MRYQECFINTWNEAQLNFQTLLYLQLFAAGGGGGGGYGGWLRKNLGIPLSYGILVRYKVYCKKKVV